MAFLGSGTIKIGFLDIFSSRIQSSKLENLDFGVGSGGKINSVYGIHTRSFLGKLDPEKLNSLIFNRGFGI